MYLPLLGRETGQILAIRLRSSTLVSRMQMLPLTYHSFEHVQKSNRKSRLPPVKTKLVSRTTTIRYGCRYVQLRSTTLPSTTFNYVTLHYVQLRSTTLPSTTFNYVTLHYVQLRPLTVTTPLSIVSFHVFFVFPYLLRQTSVSF